MGVNANTTKEKHIKRNFEVKVKVLMISDSLSKLPEKSRNKLDKSGKIAKELVEKKGFTFIGIDVVPDEPDAIKEAVIAYTEKNPVELIVTIGGTGIAKRDITVETISPLYDKSLPGFGEIFRYLTYKEVGTVAIVTRASAGIIRNTTVASLPGSPNAVALGMPLILNEIIHILNHLR